MKLLKKAGRERFLMTTTNKCNGLKDFGIEGVSV